MSISFRRPVAIIKPIIVTQPPALRAIANVEELEENIEKIKETFPDIAFTYEAVDERQKYVWRAQKQIDLAKWRISEWEAKMQEFKSIEVYDHQFLDLARRLKVIFALRLLFVFSRLHSLPTRKDLSVMMMKKTMFPKRSKLRNLEFQKKLERKM